eukprot:751688-Hanusia_phi.AAC.2
MNNKKHQETGTTSAKKRPVSRAKSTTTFGFGVRSLTFQVTARMGMVGCHPETLLLTRLQCSRVRDCDKKEVNGGGKKRNGQHDKHRSVEAVTSSTDSRYVEFAPQKAAENRRPFLICKSEVREKEREAVFVARKVEGEVDGGGGGGGGTGAGGAGAGAGRGGKGEEDQGCAGVLVVTSSIVFGVRFAP